MVKKQVSTAPMPPEDGESKAGSGAAHKVISVDKTGLYPRSPSKKVEKVPQSPLGQQLYDFIQKAGPVSLADFMDLALGHPEHGYYMKKESAKIGKAGDFVTAPEISQMFGELVGIWLIATWEKLGMPAGCRVVEMGPGKGTLMKDVLRTMRKFPNFTKSVLGVHMVETSLALREVQRQALTCDERGRLPKEDGGLPVMWHADLSQLPPGPILLVAQELLDALPVHQFVYTEKGWRERLVDVETKAEEPFHFKVIVAQEETPAVQALQSTIKLDPKAEVGAGLEVCPLAMQVVEQAAARISEEGGAALFVDYGEDFAQADTVRGLKQHAMVSWLAEPGEVDLSADVDFAAMKETVIRAGMGETVKAFGPVPQGQFLSAMGIEFRLGALLDSPKVTEQQKILLYDSYRRLTDPDQMGRKYKVLSLVGKSHQGPAVGF